MNINVDLLNCSQSQFVLLPVSRVAGLVPGWSLPPVINASKLLQIIILMPSFNPSGLLLLSSGPAIWHWHTLPLKVATKFLGTHLVLVESESASAFYYI